MDQNYFIDFNSYKYIYSITIDKIMMNQEEEKDLITQEDNIEVQPTYNFKWMLFLLIVGIIGSFVFASIKR